MYTHQFAATIKVKGKAVREREPGVFRIPFGSEYTIYLKNMSTRRAVVGITIDDADVLGGDELVVPPNDALELEGFMRDGVAQKAFKFIQETAKTQEHRGAKVEDGFIRVQFAFEEPPRQYSYTTYSVTTQELLGPSSRCYTSNTGDGLKGLSQDVAWSSDTTETSDQGFTAAGSDRNQRFGTVEVGALGEPQVLILRLLGAVEGKAVKKAVTTRKKLVCASCGTKSRSSAKFCLECGTALDW